MLSSSLSFGSYILFTIHYKRYFILDKNFSKFCHFSRMRLVSRVDLACSPRAILRVARACNRAPHIDIFQTRGSTNQPCFTIGTRLCVTVHIQLTDASLFFCTQGFASNRCFNISKALVAPLNSILLRTLQQYLTTNSFSPDVFY